MTGCGSRLVVCTVVDESSWVPSAVSPAIKEEGAGSCVLQVYVADILLRPMKLAT